MKLGATTWRTTHSTCGETHIEVEFENGETNEDLHASWDAETVHLRAEGTFLDGEIVMTREGFAAIVKAMLTGESA